MENDKTLFKQQMRQREVIQREKMLSNSFHQTDAKYCTFCGALLEEDEQFCTECGNPRVGVSCPNCGRLNDRSFCRKCGTPLNELAQETLRKVANNPKVVRLRCLNEELERLKDQIATLLHMDDDEDTSKGLTEEDGRLLAYYDELFGGMIELSASQPLKSVSHSESGRKKIVDCDLLKSALSEYQQKKTEMQAVLDTLLPDPQDPPEIQRNFLCACQQEICTYERKKVQKTVGWVCNLCGCTHGQPSECAQPELGGKWIYREEEVIIRASQVLTLYI